jgi:A/G-specific adenine glycosylase
MELGALICTPLAPRCEDCPLGKRCRARRRGIQDVIPPPTRPLAIQEVAEVAMVVFRGTRVLLVQRPPEGRWANLWEFPHAPVKKGEDAAAACTRLLADCAGIRVAPGKEILTLQHGIMHYRITMTCFAARYRSGRFSSDRYQQGKWVRLEELVNYPVSSPQRRLARALITSQF